jgi:hypothetical protein
VTPATEQELASSSQAGQRNGGGGSEGVGVGSGGGLGSGGQVEGLYSPDVPRLVRTAPPLSEDLRPRNHAHSEACSRIEHRCSRGLACSCPPDSLPWPSADPCHTNTSSRSRTGCLLGQRSRQGAASSLCPRLAPHHTAQRRTALRICSTQAPPHALQRDGQHSLSDECGSHMRARWLCDTRERLVDK